MGMEITANYFILAVIIVVLLVSLVAVSLPSGPFPGSGPETPTLKKFSSYEEMENYIESTRQAGGLFGRGIAEATISDTFGAVPLSAPSEAEGVSEDYSTTNIQVEGVDEADIVKNDGKYIYVVSGKKIIILDAYPAEGAEILSEIDLNGSVREIFINRDKLIVFGETTEYGPIYYSAPTFPSTPSVIRFSVAIPPNYFYSQMFVYVYDISDRSNPVLTRNISVDGNYYNSRMIGDYVYVIINSPIQYGIDPIPLPRIITPGLETETFPDIYYFDNPDYSYRFTTIMSLNTQQDSEDIENQIYLMGNTQNIFVSPHNIYITFMKRLSEIDFMDRYLAVLTPLFPADVALEIDSIMKENTTKYERWSKVQLVINRYSSNLTSAERNTFQQAAYQIIQPVMSDIAKEMEKTIIHRISINSGRIQHEAEGEVPGNVLNQFSMDEFDDYFRIATTTGNLARIAGEATSQNHVYVLDMNLNIVGKLEDLAPGERIYSARFLGEKSYLVTFRKIDPLFVIDLSDPANPRILGKLKIPGFSDYLHPYDENHIIGIGKETIAAESGDFSWFQGVKISLFDVTDVENPREVSKYVIGHRGTDSYALKDHKAFLFDRQKNLLVIPVLLAEIDEDDYAGDVPPTAYGEFVWQGAYVFDISLDGFYLKGRITHVEGDDLLRSGFYFSSPYSVRRSLYIGNTLYTLSDRMIKMNSLEDLTEINKLELPYEAGNYPYLE